MCAHCVIIMTFGVVSSGILVYVIVYRQLHCKIAKYCMTCNVQKHYKQAKR